MSQDDERAAMRAEVETGAVSVADYVAKYGREPALPNDTRQAELQAALARAEAADDNLNSGRELLREAWSQLNSIRAWRGAPPGVSEDWFSQFVDDLGNLLKDDRLPWMTAAAKALVAPYQRQIEQAQGSAIEAERQRDEAFTAGAEAMREACAQASEGEAYGFPPEQLTEHGQGYDRACKEIAAILRALPIPAQEMK